MESWGSEGLGVKGIGKRSTLRTYPGQTFVATLGTHRTGGLSGDPSDRALPRLFGHSSFGFTSTQLEFEGM